MRDGRGEFDVVVVVVAGGGEEDPLFKSYDAKVATPNGAANPNDFHLNTGSPAIGKGNTTFNADMGAYTSDGQGNKH